MPSNAVTLRQLGLEIKSLGTLFLFISLFWMRLASSFKWVLLSLQVG